MKEFVIEFLPGDGHKDLIVRFYDLVDLCVDTYYLGIFLKEEESVKTPIYNLLAFWKTSLVNAKQGEIVYLPIDYSDQYTGYFRFYNDNESLTVTYGFSLIMGWTINVDNYYRDVTDYEQTSEKEFVISKQAFLNTLNREIDRLML